MKTEQQILEKLEKIEKEVGDIREHMVDVDSILTPAEEMELEESLQELKEEKTVSLATIKRDRKDG